MKYLLALLLVAMGATPDHPPTRRAVCQFVDQVSAGQWTCARLSQWARKNADERDVPASLARKLAPPPEEDATDTDDGGERISNGF